MLKWLTATSVAPVLAILFAAGAAAEPAGSQRASTDASGPIIITEGGTYSGSWSSDDPDVPAVRIRTSDPVIIENATIQSRGDLIATGVAHVRLTVRNTRGVGLNPNVHGRVPGRFFHGEECDSVTLVHNDLGNTAGIYCLKAGSQSPGDTFKILSNRVRNIDGRKSDGNGGFLDFNTRIPLAGGKPENGFIERQFVQLDKVRHVAGIEIAWNEVINEPGRSRVEDDINIYLSSGTPESPIRIHDNFIRGGYTIKPWQADTSDANYRYDWSYSGGGILLGDGSAKTVEDATAFVEAYNNQVLSTSNYGIAISAGHDLVFHHNRILSAGQLADGRAIVAQNAGAYIWDIHHDAKKSPPTFFANRAHDNVIGWTTRTGRNDSWHPNASQWDNNAHWPGAITRETEENEYKLWQEKKRMLNAE
jgi:hypothetical protein